MIGRSGYTPGPATLAHVEKDKEKWTLVLTKDLRHAPEKVWNALTDPAQLREWAPFDATGSLATAGAQVKLATIGADHVSDATVVHADKPRLLEYNWGAFNMRWELARTGAGTRLTLWTNIHRPYIAMGAAGWHIAFDVLESVLDGNPIGRIVGPEAMKFEGWQRLHAEYRKQFDSEESAQ